MTTTWDDVLTAKDNLKPRGGSKFSKFLNEVSPTGTGASKKVVQKKVVQRCADPQDDMHQALPDIAQLALTEDGDPVAANDDVPAPERPTQTSEEDDGAKDETASTTSSTVRVNAHAVDESGGVENHRRDFNLWASDTKASILASQKDITRVISEVTHKGNDTIAELTSKGNDAIAEAQAKYNALMADVLANETKMMNMMTKAACKEACDY